MTRSQRLWIEHTLTVNAGALMLFLSATSWVRWVGGLFIALGTIGRYLALRRITLEGERP